MNAAAERSTLVGREPELARIERCLDGARLGAGAVLLLHGEAGIGKSRLLAAALRAATTARYCTASVVNIERARSPFGPWIDALRALVHLTPELVPTVRSDRSVYDRFLGEEPFEQGAADKRRIFIVISDALERASSRVPVMIGFDDAQWLDPESLELLAFVAPRLARSAAVLALTIRTDGTDGIAVLQAAQRLASSTTISLSPLSDGAVREMIVATVPTGKRLPRALVDAIAERAAGNPLFVSELVRDATTNENPRLLPPTIALLTQDRLSVLAPAHRRVIEACAAAGTAFAIRNVVTVTGIRRREVIDALRAGRDAGLVVEQTDAESCAFRHESIKNAVYDRLLAAERTRLHRAMAELLERAPTRSSPTLLAYHWRQAGEPDRAAMLAVRAGDDALRVHAHASARDRYREALDDHVLDATALADVEEKLGRALDFDGDALAAMECFCRAADGFLVGGLLDRALHAKLAFARAAHRAGHADSMIGACEDVLRSTTDSQLCFAARSLLAMYHVYRNEVAEGQTHIDAAAALPGPRDKRDELSLQWARALAAHYRNDEDWIGVAHDAVRLAERHGDPPLLAFTLLNFGAMARERGYDADAISAWDRGLAIADLHGLSFASAYIRCQKVEALHFAGKLEEAYRLALEASALHVDAAIARIFCASSGLALLADMDSIDALPNLLEPELLETAFATGEDNRFAPLTAAHVHAALLRGDAASVPGLIERAVARTKTFAYTSAALVTFARYGEKHQIDRIESLRGELPRSGAPRLHHMMIEAIAALRRSGQREGKQQARAALDVAERIGSPLNAASLFELLGEQAKAIEIYRSVGARGRIRRLESRGTSELTKREREIADLIGAGRTNRAIADALVLSERTVEHHAAAIYAKLGFRTRAEFIASYARSGSVRAVRS